MCIKQKKYWGAVVILFFFFCSSCALFKRNRIKKNTKLDEPKYFSNPTAVFQDSSKDIYIRSEAGSQLIEEDKVGTKKILFDTCRKEPKLITNEVMNYWGEKRYIRSFGLLQKAIKDRNDPEFTYSGIFSLSFMEDNSIDQHILSYCMRSANQERYKCFLAISDAENKELRRKAVPLFKRIQKDAAKEDKKLVTLASFFLNSMKSKKSAGGIKYVYKNKWKAAFKKPVKKPVKKSYYNKIYSAFSRRLGPTGASGLIKKINKRLKNLAVANSAKSRFLIQSYKKFYKESYVYDVRQKMKQGLRISGSLHAIVKNIIREYPSSSMRAYSLSVLLSISLSESKIVLSTAKKI